MSTVRVRFAPSPTGFFHIGSARTALFNWLYARHTGGTFVLRIEDTDRQRNTREALDNLIQSMRWLGLDWDEGPDAGGEYGPYFQSQRADIYREYLEVLRAKGRVYEQDGAQYFKISGEPQEINDAIRGKVVRTEEKDFVIFRSDGSPVFHFVNVVDDMLMKITHVIRGEDHLSNTSKHVELFKAFEAPLPIFAHIPLILKQNGPGKMSKRDEGALIEDYQKRYYLADALRNYLCLLGWSPKDDREVLPLDEIIRIFDLPGINKTNARFDERKMQFINTQYLRALPPTTFCWFCRPYLEEKQAIPEGTTEDYYQQVMAICQEKVRAVEDLPEFTRYFFFEDYPVDEKAWEKITRKGDPLERIREFLAGQSQLTEWTEASLEGLVHLLSESSGVGTGEYIHAVRYGVSGQGVGPGVYALLATLGQKRTLDRLNAFLQHAAQ